MGMIKAVGIVQIAGGVIVACALAVAPEVDAQGRGGKPSAAYPGAKPSSGWHGGHGGWRGDHGRWSGGNHGRWSGGNQGGWHRGDWGHRWHGGHWRGNHHWHGWHRGRYYHPGWTFGLGVGIGLAYPWWGWGWPYWYEPVVVERVIVDRPVGVVVEREGSFTSAPPASPRWYCPSPAGYYPEVRDCPAGWLKVLPDGGPPPAPSTAPSAPPRSGVPDDEPSVHIAPGTLGHASSPTRIAAPRTAPPTQIARERAATEWIAENAAR